MSRAGLLRRHLAVLVLASCVFAPVPGRAQYAQRSALVGRVIDAGGDALVGARVVLSGSSLLGGTRATTTDEYGRYRFAPLLPGIYSVTASTTGFDLAARSDIDLPVETTYTVDFALVLSRVVERVEVHEAAPLVDVTSSAAPDHFDTRLLQNLPTGRSLQSVLNLAPGVTDDVAFGGAQRTSNAASLDGVRIAQSTTGESWVPTGYNWLDAVQVVALGAPAEYNQFTGAIVNGVLRSGSNQLHGLGEYVAALPDWTGDNTAALPDELQEVFVPMNILSSWDANTQIGGPLRRDRLWAFAGLSVARQQHREFGYAGPFATSGYSPRGVLKLDAAPSARWALQGFYQHGATHVDGVELGPGSPTPEASADLRRRDDVWNARGHWTGSSGTLLELRVGGNAGTSRNEPHPPATRSGPPARIDLATFVIEDNTWLWLESRRHTVATAVTATQRTDGGPGSHEIRAGFEFEHRSNMGSAGYPGGMNVYEEDGVPVLAEIWAGGADSPTTRRVSGFVQDRWTIGSRLTLEPGLRIETNRGAVPGAGVVMVTTPIAPRIGAAFALTGDGRTVLRGHFGRYHDTLFNNMFEGMDTTVDNPRITAVPGDGGWVEIGRSANPAPSAISADVKPAFVDQFLVGAEHQVMETLAVEARLVVRTFGDFIGFIDPRLDEWTAFPVPDPGIDGQIGTTDDGEVLTAYQPYPGDRPLVIGNPDDVQRRYRAVQLIARKRFAANWQGQVSYTWSRAEGLNNLANINTLYWGLSPSGVGANPNYDGQWAGDQKPIFAYSEFKALGLWQAPWLGGFTLSGIYRWHSGVGWQRKLTVTQPVFLFLDAEPIGTRRTASFGVTDLRVEKTFRLGSTSSRTMGLYLDVSNAANTGVATRSVQMSGPRFGQPAAWTDPRVFRAGARVTF